MIESVTEEKTRKILLAKKQEVSDLLNNSADDSAPVELDQTQQGRLSRMDAL
ncbi:MAG: TraR/DksA family transcriptional regulator, partial [Alphaproteobacteria bacterium]|nr:TraR/DksA family transcriptional regulator [Alphaproteobacteria bacterium]